jgi:quaternary ammonium compound-resistance protein SugE
MSWLILVFAGFLETVWALSLRIGAMGWWSIAVTVTAAAGSMWLLQVAARGIPIGTAYPVWVGIGAIGTAVLGLAIFREPITASRLAFLGLLIVAIIGLKMTSPA